MSAQGTPAVRPVLLDISRLIERGFQPSATGIDRVELAYANHFMPQQGAEFLVRSTLGHRILRSEDAETLIRSVAEIWGGARRTAAEERAFAALLEELSLRPQRRSGHSIEAGKREAHVRRLIAAGGHFLRCSRWFVRGRGLREASAGRAYLHVSHMGLEFPGYFRWLKQGGVPAVFFVHDLIPIEAPDFCRDDEAEKHIRRMRTIKDHASAVLVNSKTTRESLLRFFRSQGWPEPSAHVTPLGVEPVFAAARNQKPFGTSWPYFIVIGTIEPRKNHLLLLDLWRALAAEMGDQAPRLVVLGRRGWKNEKIVELLDRPEQFSGLVIELDGLDDDRLAVLLSGARALLMPSFIEGYSLPVAEALTAGTPVLASDIPAHREVGGGLVKYLDPSDGRAWKEAVLALSPRESPARRDLVAAMRNYRSPTWSDHFAAVEGVLSNLG